MEPIQHPEPSDWRRLLAQALRPALVVVVCAACLTAGCGGGQGTLPDSPERLPYEFVPAAPSAGYRGSFEAMDLDGDGVDEEVKIDEGHGGASFLSVARIRDNQFYHLATRHLMSRSQVCGATDFTGDGTPELIWLWQDSPESAHVFVTEIRADDANASLATLHSIAFDTESGLLPDGQWGVGVAMGGAFDLDCDGATEAIAVTVAAGITLVPREIVFWEPASGGVTWRLPTGATPTGGSAVIDVTGDLRPELIIGLEAPGNGAEAGVWDDLHSYVIAVEADGNVLWSRKLGGFSSNIELAAADLDGDGTTEIVTALNYHSQSDSIPPELAVWRGADGALLDTLRTGFPANAVMIGQCERGNRIFAGSADGTLRRIGWDAGAMAVEAELDCGDAVEGLASVELSPLFDRWSLAVGTGTGRIAVLDERLRPLAVFHINETLDGARLLRPTTVHGPDGTATGGVIVRTREKTHRFILKRRPLPLWATLLLVVTVVLILLVSVPASRRAMVALLRRWLLPRNTRDESIEELLVALATAGHGKLAATSTLRRLRRQAEVICVNEGDVPPAFDERFKDAFANAVEIGVAGLERTVRLAERVGAAPAHTGRLSSALDGLKGTLEDLPARLPTQPEAEALGSDLDRILPAIDASLAGIKSSAESERSSSLGTELGRALDSRAAEFAELSVELEAPDPRALRSARVVGTPDEVAFVLDNLLGNALRAMAECSVRRLHIAVEMGAGWVTLSVEDTGKGVDGSLQQQIFTRGISDREGGGHGLPTSREILGRRGGKIELVRSSPGEGALFEIRLRLWQEA